MNTFSGHEGRPFNFRNITDRIFAGQTSVEIVETLGSIAANTALVASVYFAGQALAEDGLPSQEQVAQINTCASHLSNRESNVSEYGFSTECEDFKDQFKQSDGEQYVLPTKQQFLSDNLINHEFTKSARADTFNTSRYLLGWSFVGKGVIAFSRRLRATPNGSDIPKEAERYLRTQSWEM